MYSYGEDQETRGEKSIIIANEFKNSLARAFTALNSIRVNCNDEYNMKYRNSIEQTNYLSALSDEKISCRIKKFKSD